jgi:hypothetical protein
MLFSSHKENNLERVMGLKEVYNCRRFLEQNVLSQRHCPFFFVIIFLGGEQG